MSVQAEESIPPDRLGLIMPAGDGKENQENQPEKEEADLEKLKSWIKGGIGGHEWRQRGPYLVCRSCPIEHAVYIGIDKKLVGFDKEGKPKFVKIV